MQLPKHDVCKDKQSESQTENIQKYIEDGVNTIDKKEKENEDS